MEREDRESVCYTAGQSLAATDICTHTHTHTHAHTHTLTSARVCTGEVGVETVRGVVMTPLAARGSSTMISTSATDEPA